MARRHLPILVLALGALVTIATSAPIDPSITAEASVTVSAGELVGIDVVYDEAAAQHALEHFGWLQLEISGASSGVVVPSDEGEEAIVYDGAAYLTVNDPCTTAPCVVHYDVEVDGDDTLTIRATAAVNGDGTFLFPENRDFPEDAHLDVFVTR